MNASELVEKEARDKAQVLLAGWQEEVRLWSANIAKTLKSLAEVHERVQRLRGQEGPEADLARSGEQSRREFLALCYWRLSWALADLGSLREAVEAIQKAVHFAPISNIHKQTPKADYLVCLGQYFGEWGRSELAVRAYQEALRLGPKDDFERYYAHLGLARAFNRLGRYEEAERHGRAALAADSQQSGPHVELGRSFTSRGLVVRAAEACLDAVRLDPWNLKALGLLKRLINENPGIEEALPDIRHRLKKAWDRAFYAEAPYPDEETEAPGEDEE
jgi:tetratricopeptide (TPR) repeat protein